MYVAQRFNQVVLLIFGAKVDTKFAVCDAGGSTVDTTVYNVVSARPALQLKEGKASACKSRVMLPG